MTERKRVMARYIGDHGWYSIVDETHEEYAYHPQLFEIVENVEQGGKKT